jgi:hypothetical protein
MSEKILLLLFLLLIFLTSPLHGMVYTWTDVRGVAHFTNKEYEIPARYRARTKALYPDMADSGQTQPNNSSSQATVPVVQTQPIPSTRAETTERLKEQPVVVAPQKINSPPRTTPRRERKPRVRNADDE